MLLTLDAGNTRTKWAVFGDDDVLHAQGVEDNAQLGRLVDSLQSWAGRVRAVGISVASPSITLQLERIVQGLGTTLRWQRAGAKACGVVNGYADPGQLGADRWAALVGAWVRVSGPCVVASAGTALTVDALSSRGEFLGGLIVPGLRMMRRALVAGTAGLDDQPGHWCEYPGTTADAMHSGALNAMAGAVERMCARLEAREGRPVTCLLTGGDAVVLAHTLHRPADIVDNLALYGLLQIEKEPS